MCTVTGAHRLCSQGASRALFSRHRSTRYLHTSCFLALLLWLAPPLVRSQQISPAPLPKDPSLTTSVLLQQSLQQAPEYLELASRDEEARAHVEAARSWLAGRPSLEATYLDDQPRSAAGMTELEYGLQLPLWRPGERRDAAALGRSLGVQTEAWRTYLELTIAGRLRESLAELDEAERIQEIEREATEVAKHLLVGVERLFEAGEASALDVAQARTVLLTQQREELRVSTARERAEMAWVRLTGLRARPQGTYREPLSEKTEISADHPWLRLLSSDLAVAEESVKRARAEARGSPSVMLGTRRSRGSDTEDYNDSLLLSLSLPFGGSSHVSAQVSTMRRQQAVAQVAFKTAERELQQRLQTLQGELAVVTQSLRLTDEQVALDRQQWEMARTAFEVGEVTLFQVLTALRQSHTSVREHELLKLRRESLVAQINQTVGVLP